MSEHRSVSQLKLYERCPYAYKLARIDKVWQRPAAWLPQGSAVHEAAEAWERSGRTMTLEQTQDVFRDSYAQHVNTYLETTPDFEWWFKSGRYGGELDIERRYQIGLEQTQKYLDWYNSHPQEVIWIAPDGTPGIELGFDVDLDGVMVRGFIDAIIDLDGEVIVRDNKTGNKPGDDFQLAVYAAALTIQFGISKPEVGDYWMGRTGKPTLPYTLDQWPVTKVTEAFHDLEENIRAERFDPLPEPAKCRFCDVSYHCEFAM
jgi:putative RecB family exonuclease